MPLFKTTLPYRPPYDWDSLSRFLGARAIAGVEVVDGPRYARTFDIEAVTGHLVARHDAARKKFNVTIDASDEAVVPVVSGRLRRLLDLDADPAVIGRALGKDRTLARLVTARPGLRVPGAFDPFEISVRAILGQQVTVAGATKLGAKLVQMFGRPAEAPGPLHRLFPSAAQLARADVAAIGMPRARANTIRALAEAVAADARFFERGTETLRSIRGIGDWTAQYIAMRAFGDGDAFPPGDAGLRRAMPNVEARSERWRPWRAYAALHLWMKDT
jgi:AraC family transcriptional regulator of adaptative response / DNA-3-methyladenine glycosylase II